MQAGFDLSDMSVVNWKLFLDRNGISHEPEQTDNGWVWRCGEFNFVVTASNPITGMYYRKHLGAASSEIGFLGYVGIEGDSSFVANAFVDFKELADYCKGEEFGRRGFI